jgi:microcystin-dependent protein
VNAVASPADTSNPTGNTLAMANIYKAEAPSVSLNAGSVDVAANTTGATGAGQSHTNMQPYQTVNFIIALQGTFPSRN